MNTAGCSCYCNSESCCSCCLSLSSFNNCCFCLQTLLALYLVDDFTGFQFTNLVELPEPYGIIFLWGAVFPALFIFVASITNFIFKDNVILKVLPTAPGLL